MYSSTLRAWCCKHNCPHACAPMGACTVMRTRTKVRAHQGACTHPDACTCDHACSHAQAHLHGKLGHFCITAGGLSLTVHNSGQTLFHQLCSNAGTCCDLFIDPFHLLMCCCRHTMENQTKRRAPRISRSEKPASHKQGQLKCLLLRGFCGK
jgi:hypothetical protein